MLTAGCKVNLIARDNGLGLSRDARLLAAALEAHGCSVHFTALDESHERRRWKLARGWRAALAHARHTWSRHFGRPPFDLNIMFEHLWPDQLPLARLNIALPNPEWFDSKDVLHLDRMDRVWTKTHHAEALFRARGCRTSWIGFASEDCRDPSVPRSDGFFHLAGGSRTKGTDRLLALWARHPEWPMLTVVRHGQHANQAAAANIQVLSDYLSDEALRQLQNSHRFHLCPSETEGYGHYIGEAMCVGAVAITVDAAPMNELLAEDRGLLVTARANGGMGLATRYLFDEASLEAAIESAIRMPPEAQAALGQRARAWFDANRRRFPGDVGRALAELAL
jgi:hypothetical protein